MDSMDSLELRKGKARKIGIITGVCVFVLVLGGAIAAMAMGFGAPWGNGDDEKRGRALGMGSVMMGFWAGLIAWGIARLVLRLKASRPPG